MKFIDEIIINLRSGKGGDGFCSFRREKYIPLGGPDGGDGGKGGNICIEAKKNLLSLSNINHLKSYVAENGNNGSTNKKTGLKGKDTVIEVPLGTRVFDWITKEFILDVQLYGKRYILAKGGSNGYGNYRFKTSINRSPKKTTKGGNGSKKIVKLEINAEAYISLVGLPNSGKSSFTSSISNIKVFNHSYPFSNKSIYLGRYSRKNYKIIDTPSIVKKSRLKKGIGLDFLKHSLKSNIIFYVLDFSNDNIKNIINNLCLLEYELLIFNKNFFFKKRYIIVNKADKIKKDKFLYFLKYLLNCINKKKYAKILIFSNHSKRNITNLQSYYF